MIPKVIHYCWFGGTEKPKLAQKCIKSWKKHCKKYQIIEWNENNFDVWSAPKFVQDAYKAKKWAFVTDYVRLKVVYDYGGVYLDTDVELLKNLDRFLQYPAFFGMQQNLHIATGLGFGSIKNNEILLKLMKQYQSDNLILDNINDLLAIACPELNHEIFQLYGYVKANIKQTLINGAVVYPTEYFCPMDFDYVTRTTNNTVSIHWFSGSWTKGACNNEKIIFNIKKNRLKNKFSLKYMFYKLMGEKRYNKIVAYIKRRNK